MAAWRSASASRTGSPTCTTTSWSSSRSSAATTSARTTSCRLDDDYGRTDSDAVGLAAAPGGCPGVNPVASIFDRSSVPFAGRGEMPSRPSTYSSVVTGVTSSGARPLSRNTSRARSAHEVTGPEPWHVVDAVRRPALDEVPGRARQVGREGQPADLVVDDRRRDAVGGELLHGPHEVVAVADHPRRAQRCSAAAWSRRRCPRPPWSGRRRRAVSTARPRCAARRCRRRRSRWSSARASAGARRRGGRARPERRRWPPTQPTGRPRSRPCRRRCTPPR